MNKKKRNDLENESEVESEIVTVGSNQSYRALMVTILVLLVGGGVYYYYFSSTHEEDLIVVQKEEIKRNIQELKEKLEQVPDNVMVPERIITDPLPSLPPLPTPQIVPEIKEIKEESKSKEEEISKDVHVSNIPVLPKQNLHSRKLASNLPATFPPIGNGGYPRERRSTQMLAISGGGTDKAAVGTFLSSTGQLNKATRAKLSSMIITQGKVIDAILETAINSDLQGMLRAIVSRDIYAETGDTVLIPKGSKLLGVYSLDSNLEKACININWNRIVLPHGRDIAISSPGTDELGREGIFGVVDNKIVSALFSSIALAGVSIGSAVVGQKASNFINVLTPIEGARSISATEIDFSLLKDVIGEAAKDIPNDKWKLGLGAIGEIRNAKNEQDLLKTMKREIAKVLGIEENKVNIAIENVNQLLQQLQRKSKSIYDEAIGKSVNDFSKDVRSVIDRYVDKKPTVYVNQGTALKVFVNQDIVFDPHIHF